MVLMIVIKDKMVLGLGFRVFWEVREVLVFNSEGEKNKS